MRQVVGQATRSLDDGAFAELRERHPGGLVIDLGTGDGKHVLTVARARPDALVVGVDAAPQAMRSTALHAARKPARGGLPNAVFVWAAVEQLPPELAAVSEVHALMPWGSLLRSLVTPDAAVLQGVAGRCVAGAPFLLTLNLHAWRPPVPEVGSTPEPTPGAVLDPSGLAASYAAAGWSLESAQYADVESLAALGTSWTKRLASSRDELAVLTLRGRIG